MSSPQYVGTTGQTVPNMTSTETTPPKLLYMPWRWMSHRAWTGVITGGLVIYTFSYVPLCYILLCSGLMNHRVSQVYDIVYAGPTWCEHHTWIGYKFYAWHWRVMNATFGDWHNPLYD